MRNLNLNNYGVQEMNAGEMRENNGGYGSYAWPTMTKEQIDYAGSYVSGVISGLFAL